MKQPKEGLPKDGAKFWRMRSHRYNRLEWARKESYLDAFLRLGRFKRNHQVLDVGTGTGIVAKALAKRVKGVTAIDISPDMLHVAKMQAGPAERYLLGDIHSLRFPSDYFDRITARMVFHHIVDGSHAAIRECYRLLSKNGLMVLSEGVPPLKRLKHWYTEMFRLKEHRITFYREDLISLMRHGGFRDIRVSTFWMRRVSIRKWLQSSGIPNENQDKIFQMHLDLEPAGKKAYRMKATTDDCLIDMKFLILVGEKS
jgi:ubiquinone/menaquinone biosynthesis C-methylase UbiE